MATPGNSNLQITPGGDRQLQDLLESAQRYNVIGQSFQSLFSDPHHSVGAEDYQGYRSSRFLWGQVMLSFPFMNSYIVQLEGVAGVKTCTSMDFSSSAGCRTAYQPLTQVLVYVEPGSSLGHIVRSFPSETVKVAETPFNLTSGDAQSGFDHEAFYELRHKLKENGGVRDFSGSNCRDLTVFDNIFHSRMGDGLLVNEMEIRLSLDEMCGVFLNRFDGHTRIAGRSLDIMSLSSELSSRNVNGELQEYRYGSVYMWEALGAYGPEEMIFKEYSDSEILSSAHAKFDIPEENEDVKPFSRRREYGGYLGQGGKRQLVVPPSIDGISRYKRSDQSGSNSAPRAVFDESIAMDGDYLLRAAKNLLFQSTSYIPSPNQIRIPEDSDPNQSDTLDNYKPAGFYGDQEEHKVQSDLESSSGDMDQHLGSVALNDVAANVSWKSGHPFYYHTKDFEIPKPEEPSQERLDFSKLKERYRMEGGGSFERQVDHRFASRYRKRTTTFGAIDGGGFIVEGGCGERILMKDGVISMSAPGGVNLDSGKDVVLLGSDVIIRAHDSVDVSAAHHDVSIKAEKNVRVLAGNSGEGGILLESKAESKKQEYDSNTIGEDIVSSGIVMKAPTSDILGYCDSMYVRSNAEGNSSGRVVFDAGKGASEFIVKARSIKGFVRDDVRFYYGPSGESTNVEAGTIFSSGMNHIGRLDVDGSLSVLGSALIESTVMASGGYASASSTQVGKITQNQKELALAPVRERSQEVPRRGKSEGKAVFQDDLYQSGAVGNDKKWKKIQFSFRDDTMINPNTHQYGSQDLEFIEPRWVQMTNLGQASGGSEWDEPVVSYNGNKTYPWPGDKYWNSEGMVQMESGSLYDYENGNAKEMGPDYEDPSKVSIRKVPMRDGLKVIG